MRSGMARRYWLAISSAALRSVIALEPTRGADHCIGGTVCRKGKDAVPWFVHPTMRTLKGDEEQHLNEGSRARVARPLPIPERRANQRSGREPRSLHGCGPPHLHTNRPAT